MDANTTYTNAELTLRKEEVIEKLFQFLPEDVRKRIFYHKSAAGSFTLTFVDITETEAVTLKEQFDGAEILTSKLRETSIRDLGLSIRLINALKGLDVETVADLLKLDADKLSQARRVADVTLQEMKEFMDRKGLKFKGE